MATTYTRRNFDGTVQTFAVEDDMKDNPIVTWDVLSLLMSANGFVVAQPDPEPEPQGDVSQGYGSTEATS